VSTDPVVATPLAKIKPLVSLVLPAYNEEAILEENLGILCRYMARFDGDYRWEIVPPRSWWRRRSSRAAASRTSRGSGK
jgi:hypothetical protein